MSARRHLINTIGYLTVCMASANSTHADPYEDIFYIPYQTPGGNIESWIDFLGEPPNRNIEDVISNPHTGEPVEIVSLIYPNVVATFWLNKIGGDSILLEMKSDSPAFLDNLNLPFSIRDRASLTALGDPISVDQSSIVYRDCGDAHCAYIKFRISSDSIVGLDWSWEVD
jgi:hypothetical protein